MGKILKWTAQTRTPLFEVRYVVCIIYLITYYSVCIYTYLIIYVFICMHALKCMNIFVLKDFEVGGHHQGTLGVFTLGIKCWACQL